MFWNVDAIMVRLVSIVEHVMTGVRISLSSTLTDYKWRDLCDSDCSRTPDTLVYVEEFRCVGIGIPAM